MRRLLPFCLAATLASLTVLPVTRAQTADKPYVALIQNTTSVEDAFEIIKTQFAAQGLKEDEQYTLNYSSALGDFATLNSLIDVAVEDGADLIFALQTVTLEAAVKRAGATPIVFHIVSDPYVAGVGRSPTDKKANITGIYFDDITVDIQQDRLELLRRCMPEARRIGVVFTPADAESVLAKDNLAKAAANLGMEVQALPVESVSELSDSLLALAAREIDAVQLVNSSVISASAQVVINTAKRNGIPVFSNVRSHVFKGAVGAWVPDTDEGARRAAAMAIRILKGEKPSAIPLERVQNFRFYVNPRAAASLSVLLPADLLAEPTTERTN